ncbi:hypothetical protein [Kiloniella sp.]|uniref:hypothetical protein n=1 Tax=Kiloniella sp. TaxID=1938587 RepID=UPI003B027C5A
MLIVIYLLYVKLSETIHINRLLGGRHLFLLNKAEKSHCFVVYGLNEKHYFISTRQQTMGQVVTVVLGRKNGNSEGLELK